MKRERRVLFLGLLTAKFRGSSIGNRACKHTDAAGDDNVHESRIVPRFVSKMVVRAGAQGFPVGKSRSTSNSPSLNRECAFVARHRQGRSKPRRVGLTVFKIRPF